MVVKVVSYAGFKADERPLRFQLGDRWMEVREVTDRWYEPDATYFKVSADDGHTYILRHAEANDEWTLAVFRA